VRAAAAAAEDARGAAAELAAGAAALSAGEYATAGAEFRRVLVRPAVVGVAAAATRMAAGRGAAEAEKGLALEAALAAGGELPVGLLPSPD
jgi:hypothetical protein